MLERILHGDELQATRLRLAEQRLAAGFTSVEQTEHRDATPDHLARLEAIHRQALAEYEAALSLQPLEAPRVQASGRMGSQPSATLPILL